MPFKIILDSASRFAAILGTRATAFITASFASSTRASAFEEAAILLQEMLKS